MHGAETPALLANFREKTRFPARLVSVLSSRCPRVKPDEVHVTTLNAMATEFIPARDRMYLEVKAKLESDCPMNYRRNDLSVVTDAEDSTGPFGNGKRIGEAKKPGPVNTKNTRIGSWNVWGIAESKDGEINAKRRDLQHVLDESERRGERLDLLFVQETWLSGDDDLEIEGYHWLGRNRTKIDPDAPHDSGGSGVLVHDSIKHRVSILSKPTYGETEGVM